MIDQALLEHAARAVPDWTVLVVKHDRGGGYFCLHRDSPRTRAIRSQGAGLHLKAAISLARELRDEAAVLNHERQRRPSGDLVDSDAEVRDSTSGVGWPD